MAMMCTTTSAKSSDPFPPRVFLGQNNRRHSRGNHSAITIMSSHQQLPSASKSKAKIKAAEKSKSSKEEGKAEFCPRSGAPSASPPPPVEVVYPKSYTPPVQSPPPPAVYGAPYPGVPPPPIPAPSPYYRPQYYDYDYTYEYAAARYSPPPPQAAAAAGHSTNPPHPQHPYYYSPHWQVPPAMGSYPGGTGGPADLPSITAQVPTGALVGHLPYVIDHNHPSMSSFDRMASNGSGYSLDSFVDPMTMTGSRHHRKSSSGGNSNYNHSASNDSRGGNANNAKKRGSGKQTRRSGGGCSGGNSSNNCGGGEMLGKINSSSSGITVNLGICLDDNATLLQIKGYIVQIAKDQDGSRFIQQRMDHIANHKNSIASYSEELNLVFSEATSAMEELWNDVYGNFILQKLLDHGTEKMKEKLGERFHPHVVSLSTRVYGCRVIQKALDTLPKENVAKLVSAFRGRVCPCIHDHNGNHVIQKSITVISNFAKDAREHEEQERLIREQQRLPQQDGEENKEEEVTRKEDESLKSSVFVQSLDPIITEVIEDIEGLSRHPYGCRVVQRMLEHCVEPHKTKILDSIISHHKSLVDDQYGNYVVQRVLSYGRTTDKEAIFETISGEYNVLRLSKRKQASNVVEMMIKHGNADQRHKIIQEMLDCTYIDQNGISKSGVVSMAMDAYANYVVKTALDVVEVGPQRVQLYNVLASNLHQLEEIPFAKHIVTRVQLHLQETSQQEKVIKNDVV